MVDETRKPTNELTEKEKLKKRFPPFSDEEIEERLEASNSLKGDELFERREQIFDKHLARRKQEKGTKEVEAKKEEETGKEIQQEKAQENEAQQKKAKELSNELKNDTPPKTEEKPLLPPKTNAFVTPTVISVAEEDEEIPEEPPQPTKVIPLSPKLQNKKPMAEEEPSQPTNVIPLPPKPQDKKPTKEKTTSSSEGQNAFLYYTGGLVTRTVGGVGEWAFWGLGKWAGRLADLTAGRSPSKMKDDKFSNIFKGFGRWAGTILRAPARTAQFGLHLVGDTFAGMKKMKWNFNPKKRKMPRNWNWAENYRNTSNTRNTFRGRSWAVKKVESPKPKEGKKTDIKPENAKKLKNAA